MKTDLTQCLPYIDPAALSYQEWVSVGMALHAEGFACEVWDEWSRGDRRYHAGECEKKWRSFGGGGGAPVSGGTIVMMAQENGYRAAGSGEGYALDWDSVITGDDLRILDTDWVEGKEIEPPGGDWNPAGELITYLETLFDADEIVGYVTESWQKDEKHLPTKGVYHQTAGQLIAELAKCENDIGRVIGDYKPEAGAWIRFNPLDGKGVRNENVTEFRYALVESDDMDIEKQNAVIRELELPVATLVHSGGKSLHAIVRIDASSYDEYRKRVEYLYSVLKKNGMTVDTQNKNPSRLSRMPGVTRNGMKQFLVDTNLGMGSWGEWKDWIEAQNDDLPDQVSLSDVWGNIPPLAPELISGILRHGHKLLLTGPSKAGKSFALIELCIAIAEGRDWMGLSCARGKVLYVNLELDEASCYHRFQDVYSSLQWPADHIGNLDIWNLRGKSAPMDKLVPKLIRRCMKRNYTAVIIDPIYKVLTGDENSADQMARFCNQFDKICSELGCAVIYCHHHSKGEQGGKRSMDRASGSGVFARDPDALLDLIELPVSDELREQQRNEAECRVYLDFLKIALPDWENEIPLDDRMSSSALFDWVRENATGRALDGVAQRARAAREENDRGTAWRIEATLREFSKPPAVNCWFRYPIHRVDESGVLSDVSTADGQSKPWERRKKEKTGKTKAEKAREKEDELEAAFALCDTDGTGEVRLGDLMNAMGLTRNAVKNRVDESQNFERTKEGKITKCQCQKTQN